MSIRVLLADEQCMVREGLCRLLQDLPNVRLVAQAGDGQQILSLLHKHTPDLIVMNVALPGLNGIEVTRRALAEFPALKVIGLSLRANRRQVLGMLKAGATGFLLKSSPFRELAEAIKVVSAGGSYLPQPVADIVVQSVQSPQAAELPPSQQRLTPREREVMQLIAESLTSREVAAKLNLSLKTVYTHRRNLMRKLKTRNLAQLTKIAIRDGLTTLEPKP